MLCQFTVKNFQCIKDELTLDLQATPITENADSLIRSIDGETFLPLAAIYGPNGAGKSTVIHALYSICHKIMKPIQAVTDSNSNVTHSSSGNLIKPFKFSKDTIERPTEYELFFRTKTSEYQYKASILKSKVLHESLYRKQLKGKYYSEVFSRSEHQIALHGNLKRYGISDISEELLLLSYLGITHRRNAIIDDIMSWLERGIQFINYGNPWQDAEVAIAEDVSLKKLIVDLLSEMDIDVSDYRVEEQNDNIDVYTIHSVNGENYELKLGEESSGTIKILGILPHIASSILHGTTLVIDELDAKLHPLLLRYIIQLYNNPQTNRYGAQLIFTSHDVTTMTGELFRRDEIWFVAKTDDLASHMYSLVEIRSDDGKAVRKDARYDKQYIEGKYGADPYLRRIIDWGKY